MGRFRTRHSVYPDRISVRVSFRLGSGSIWAPANRLIPALQLQDQFPKPLRLMNSVSGVVAQQTIRSGMRGEQLLSRQQEVFHTVNENLGGLKLIDIGHLHVNSSVIAGLYSVPGQMVIRS